MRTIQRGAVFALVFLAGCFSIGAKVSPEQLSTLRKGQSTYAEVVQNLGPPTYQTVTSRGTRIATWSYVQSSPRAASFIPIVGALAGGNDTKTDAVTANFDTAGILVDYSSTTGQLGSGLGFASGADVDRVENQPRR